MPQSVVREKLESLDINIEGVMKLLPGRRDRDPAKTYLLLLNSSCQWCEGRMCQITSTHGFCRLRLSVV
jgi:hypothetical protein